MSLLILMPTWTCWISCRNRYAGLLFLHFLVLLNARVIAVEYWHKTSLRLIYRYYFVRCWFELRFPSVFLAGLFAVSNSHDFCVTTFSLIRIYTSSILSSNSWRIFRMFRFDLWLKLREVQNSYVFTRKPWSVNSNWRLILFV